MSNKRIPKKSTTKLGEYSLISKFPGYSAREDPTKKDPAYLVSPSKNVVIKTAERIALVKGYALDGASSTTIDSGILSNYDFLNIKGDIRQTRSGFMTYLNNDGKIQYRYNGVWINLKSSLTSIRHSYCTFFDTTELIKLMLWVDGTSNIYEWNGAVTTIASATATTLTKQGTTTWAQEGFYKARNKSIVVSGVTYTYTGGETTTTLTGLSADLSATAVGTVVHQLPITTALSAMTGILSTFTPTVIGCGRKNQIYLGSSTSNNLYISKTNLYTNYSFTSPVRIVGEGALLPLSAPPVAFIAQEARESTSAYDLYISLGSDAWSVVRATLSSDLTSETLEMFSLKSAPLQGAISGRLVGKMKNHIVYIANDKTANFFGYMSYQYVPVIEDFSFPIIDDMNSYDFTDGSIFYHKNYIYVSIPKSGLIRIYNMTDQTQEQYSGVKAIEDISQQPWFWEAPVTYPISGFYTVDGELYGHGYNTSESYKLFSGGSFNGQDIDSNATFAYDEKGDRTQSKVSDEIWIEGYIKQNTILNATIKQDLDASSTSQATTVNGNDSTIVGFGSAGNSLGSSSLGSNPLGGTSTLTTTLPAWFHVSKTFSPSTYYLEQIYFNTKGIDLDWELICFGTRSQLTTEGNNSITQ